MTEELVLSFDDFSAAETADMEVRANGKATGWIWTFAGPGHPKTVDQGNRIARQALKDSQAKEAARVNNKKWKPDEESVEEIRARNINFIIERLVGWSDVKFIGASGKPEQYPFTPDNARKLLADPAKSGLLSQAMMFLGDEDAFMKH